MMDSRMASLGVAWPCRRDAASIRHATTGRKRPTAQFLAMNRTQKTRHAAGFVESPHTDVRFSQMETMVPEEDSNDSLQGPSSMRFRFFAFRLLP